MILRMSVLETSCPKRMLTWGLCPSRYVLGLTSIDIYDPVSRVYKTKQTGALHRGELL